MNCNVDILTSYNEVFFAISCVLQFWRTNSEGNRGHQLAGYQTKACRNIEAIVLKAGKSPELCIFTARFGPKPDPHIFRKARNIKQSWVILEISI